MYVPVMKLIFPKKDSYFLLKKTNFTKDIFSKKLGKRPTIEYNLKTKTNNHSNTRHPNFLKNMSSFPKYNSDCEISNSINKGDKGDNSNKISNSRNKIIFPSANKALEMDNKKQMNFFQFNTIFRNFDKNKKNLKIFLDKIKIDDNSNIKIEENNPEKLKYDHLPDIKRDIKNQQETKKSKNLIKSFFEDFIEISHIYDSFEKFKFYIDKFNEEYFLLFEIDSLPLDKHENSKFLNTYKYASILIICLIFLSKDENLYKENTLKMKELLEQYIYITIYSLDYKKLDSSKINFFIDKFESEEKLKEKNIIDKLNEIINLLFLKKLNEYKKIRKCLKQLANNIDLLNPQQILKLVNKSILYCHNSKYQNKNKIIDKIKTKTNFYESDIETKIPFIKEKSNKKYCLIFNLNETIIHNMNLPFGEYFFVRPGLFDLIDKIHDIYEIIIFASEEKKVVYDIINKIDNKNFIDYILYKKHCIYEDGNIIKKLELIGRDMKKIIYVDNSEISAKYNKKNLYKISSWYNNIFDEELIKLGKKLINIYDSETIEEDITQKLYGI